MKPGITMHSRLLLLLIPFALSACDQLGLDETAKIAAAKEAEGKAVGSGCRHSGRALEDCYILNPKAQKAAVFTGWRDMDAYMRENKIEVVAPPDYRAKPSEEKPAEAKPVETKPAEAKTNAEKPKETKDAAKPAAKH